MPAIDRATRSACLHAVTSFCVATAAFVASCGRAGFDASHGPDATDTNSNAAPVLAQQATGTKPNMTTLTVSLPGATTAGNLLVMVGGTNANAISTVTGGGVATWSPATSSWMYSNVEIWYGVVTSASTTGVTIQSTTPGDIRMNLTEWSWSVPGQATILDHASATAGTTSPASPPAITTTSANDLLVVGVADYYPNSLGTPSPGSWSSMTPMNDANYVQGSWYQVAPSLTTYAPAISDSGHNWDAAIAAFKCLP
jgi:hypothetical protein